MFGQGTKVETNNEWGPANGERRYSDAGPTTSKWWSELIYISDSISFVVFTIFWLCQIRYVYNVCIINLRDFRRKWSTNNGICCLYCIYKMSAYGDLFLPIWEKIKFSNNLCSFDIIKVCVLLTFKLYFHDHTFD